MKTMRLAPRLKPLLWLCYLLSSLAAQSLQGTLFRVPRQKMFLSGEGCFCPGIAKGDLVVLCCLKSASIELAFPLLCGVCVSTCDLPPTLSTCNQAKCLGPPSLAGISPEAKAVLCMAPRHYPYIITQATLLPPCPVAKA
eukprot:g14735.t1